MKLNRLMQVTMLAAVLMTALVKKDDPEVLLRAAIEKESVDGDLRAAIQQYEKIARSGNRAAAAKALVRMGQCYEKLGDTEARKAYERAVREFGDQKDSASAARARLAAMAGPRDSGQGVRTRLIWDKSLRYVMNVSADGQWAPYNIIENAGLGIRNLVTGEQRVLKTGQAHWEGLDECLVSPDGKTLVFLWWQWAAKEGAQVGYSLRTIRADGTGERILWDIGQAKSYLMPRAWSPDGKQVAVRDDRRDGQSIVLIEVESGKRRVIPMPPESWPERMAFSRDGRWLVASGYFTKPRGQHVFTLDLTSGNPAPQIIVENSLLVGITPDDKGLLHARSRDDMHELHLLPVTAGKPSGESRHLNAVANFDGEPLGITPQGTLFYETRTTTADAWMSGFDLDAAATGKPIFRRPAASMGPFGREGSMKFTRDGKKASIIMPRGAVLIRSLEDGTESTILPQLEGFWHIEWTADGQWLLANANGKDGRNGLHRIDPRTGAATLVTESGNKLRPFGAFTAAPDGRTVYWPGAERTMSALDLQTLDVRAVGEFDGGGNFRELRTSPDGTKLALIGENRIVVMNLATGEKKPLVQRRGIFLGGDWSPDSRFLFTTFGEQEGPVELYKIPLDGGTPVVKPLSEHFRNIRINADGKSIAMTRWNQHRQVWALENFLPQASK